jgi:hypothetical protein
MQEEAIQRPLPVGTRIVYYNKAQCRNMEAIVKDAGHVSVWVIDQEKSEADEHFISYKDVVRVIEYADLR